MKMPFRAPSPALVVSLVALFVALGGTTYAATSPPKNSVGTLQIKNGAVTKQKINKKTISALRGSRGPVGPAGPTGATGNTGPQGAQGLQGIQGQPGLSGYQIVQAQATMPSTFVGDTLEADCPSGKVALGGGEVDFVHALTVEASSPVNSGQGWSVTWSTVSGSQVGVDTAINAFAVCAKVG